jgi:aspartyl-tRNA(Asn)/glutamyl-tRNA(Gln) amidotransferase subunit B
LFETVADKSGEPVEAAHLITGEIMRLMNQMGTPPEGLTLDGQKLAALIGLVTSGKSGRNAYKETVEAVFADDIEPEAYIAQKGLMMVTDDQVVAEAVAAVLADRANEEALTNYRSGKVKAFGFLMGQVMKKLGGAGNPDLARKALEDSLKE